MTFGNPAAISGSTDSGCAGTFREESFEFADVLQFGQFVSDELHAERGFDSEHQVDVMDGIPAGNVLTRHFVAERQRLIVERILEYPLQALIYFHLFLLRVRL
jgi:hypothetical protein